SGNPDLSMQKPRHSPGLQSGIRESNPLEGVLQSQPPEMGAVPMTVRAHNLTLGDLSQQVTDRLRQPDHLGDSHHFLPFDMIEAHLPGSVLYPAVSTGACLRLLRQLLDALDAPPLALK